MFHLIKCRFPRRLTFLLSSSLRTFCHQTICRFRIRVSYRISTRPRKFCRRARCRCRAHACCYWATARRIACHLAICKCLCRWSDYRPIRHDTHLNRAISKCRLHVFCHWGSSRSICYRLAIFLFHTPPEGHFSTRLHTWRRYYARTCLCRWFCFQTTCLHRNPHQCDKTCPNLLPYCFSITPRIWLRLATPKLHALLFCLLAIPHHRLLPLRIWKWASFQLRSKSSEIYLIVGLLLGFLSLRIREIRDLRMVNLAFGELVGHWLLDILVICVLAGSAIVTHIN